MKQFFSNKWMVFSSVWLLLFLMAFLLMNRFDLQVSRGNTGYVVDHFTGKIWWVVTKERYEVKMYQSPVDFLKKETAE